MRKIEDSAALFFIFAVAILSAISILGVWDFFSEEVISKSFQTLGLLAIIAIVVMVAGKYVDKGDVAGYVPQVSPAFGIIKQITLTTLIVSASFLAILGVLAIWEVIDNKEVLYKAVSTVSIMAFGSFLIVMTARDRERKEILPTQ